ncbi:MAG: peptidase E [Gemmatimonadota bacterium]|nr:peptidase E [Gemmatimonadota bacterium]
MDAYFTGTVVPASSRTSITSLRIQPMDRHDFIITSAVGTAGAFATKMNRDSNSPSNSGAASDPPRATRKILIAGGNYNTAFIRYMAQLTGKARPRICYLPTAAADNSDSSLGFFRNCAPLNVEPFVQPTFIESLTQKLGWDEVLLSMDGIVCSGGNTLNQQAIWKAQGIDLVLKSAWDRGIVLGGASAGSLCWFEEGTTDSRPKALSIVKCLGFLKGSHSPHYDAEAGRRPLYHELIRTGAMKPGYACDNDAGIYFEDNEVKRVVSARDGAKVYYVSVSGGTVAERVLTPEPIA